MRHTIDHLNNDNIKNSKIIEEFKDNLKALEHEKEELYQKNLEQELSLKKYVDLKNEKDSLKDSKEKGNIANKNQHIINSKTIKEKLNANYNENTKIEDLKPAKLIIKDLANLGNIDIK